MEPTQLKEGVDYTKDYEQCAKIIKCHRERAWIEGYGCMSFLFTAGESWVEAIKRNHPDWPLPTILSTRDSWFMYYPHADKYTVIRNKPSDPLTFVLSGGNGAVAMWRELEGQEIMFRYN